jgi:predicted peptidase
MTQQLQLVPPRYGYQLYLPKGVWQKGKKWPLILYLHGKSLRGADLSRVAAYGLPKRLKKDKAFPFVVVAPQLPADMRWTDTKVLGSLVADVSKLYPVDKGRMYVVGFSMGASGAWRVACDYPQLFAAMVSVAGTYDNSLATCVHMKTVPVWAIHGTADKEASPEKAKQVVQTLKKVGGKAYLTLLNGKDHSIPDVLEKGDVYHWLLQNHK